MSYGHITAGSDGLAHPFFLSKLLRIRCASDSDVGDAVGQIAGRLRGSNFNHAGHWIAVIDREKIRSLRDFGIDGVRLVFDQRTNLGKSWKRRKSGIEGEGWRSDRPSKGWRTGDHEVLRPRGKVHFLSGSECAESHQQAGERGKTHTDLRESLI